MTAKWKEKQANRVKCDKKMDFQAHERTDKCQTDGLAESISGKEKPTNKIATERYTGGTQMNVQIDKLEKMLNKTHLEVVPSSNKPRHTQIRCSLRVL